MKVLIDMNLSPAWCYKFTEVGWESAHWSSIGSATASDDEIMRWAAENGYLVFTHDLDFGALLAAGGRQSPSVLQLRCEDTRPQSMAEIVIQAMRDFETALNLGALVTIDPRRQRATLLPLRLRQDSV